MARWKRSNTNGRSSSWKPGPVVADGQRRRRAGSTSIVPPSGLHLAALSSRLVTARAIRSPSPRTSVGSSSPANVSSGARRRVRSIASRDDLVEPDVARLAGSAWCRGPARRRRRPARSARRAPRSRPRAAPRDPRARAAPRRASAAGWRGSWRSACAARARRRRPGCAGPGPSCSSASSVRLNVWARRASSSPPRTSSRSLLEPLGVARRSTRSGG